MKKTINIILFLLLASVIQAQNNLIPQNSDCSSTRPDFSFNIKRAWISNTSNNVHNEGTPLAGDIDGDGKAEIIAMSADGNKVYIFEGKNGNVIGTIEVGIQIIDATSYDVSFPGLICDSNNDGKGEVFVVSESGHKMFLYEVSSAPGIRPIVFTKVWENNVSVQAFSSWGGLLPIVADFEGDGTPEFVVEGQIINSATGNIMTTLPLKGAGSWGRVTAPYAADIDGDGLSEVLVGTDIYKYAAGGYTLYARCPSYSTGQEGVNMVADINQDGILDVVYSDSKTSTNTVVVWTPSTNTIIGTFSFATSNGVSYPFVGDIDGVDNGGGKKYPEICVNTAFKLYAYAYNGSTFTNKWQMSHTDRSAATSLTLFDFNLDGTVELVYRDETNLRIFDGSGSSPVEVWSTPCYSVTTTETPIVVDVTGDGSANIVVTGNVTGDYIVKGEVMVFEGAESKWASCPNVWNQQLYSNLHVNSDLTIPRTVKPVNLTFTQTCDGKNGNKIQLYNGGPMQAPTISERTYCPIDLASDPFVVGGEITILGNQVTMEIKFGNQGMAVAAGNMPIQFYSNSITPANIIGNATLGGDLPAGQTRTITKTFTITGTMPTQFFVRIMDDGTNFPATGAFSDCDLTNNTKAFGTLELTKEVTSNLGCTNGLSVFTIKVKNNETTTRNNIVLIDSLGAGWTFISSTPSAGTTVGSYNATTRKVSWTIPSLSSGQSAELILIAKSATDGKLVNTTWVESIDGSPLEREYKTAYVIVDIAPAPAAPTVSPASANVCAAGTTVTLTASSNDGTQFQWFKDNSPITGATSSTYQATSVGSYTVTVTTSGNCTSAMSTPVNYTLGAAYTDIYWKKTASNSNWNDPSNWTDAAGIAINVVPTACNNVHIPGNADNYPSLDATTTPRTTYGNPTCKDIIYHFGGEVAQPHLLTYERAFVDYNFGYLDAANHYKSDGDPRSASPMKRGQWYALSAPLKKMVTGDFSVGGYPNMWQREFELTTTVLGDFAGQWKTPDGTNAIELGSDRAYAISVWAGEYIPGSLGEGQGYHTNLNALNGILQMPYFENPAVSALHRIHAYNGTTSTFKYYNSGQPNLPITGETPGQINRQGEAYRFIFDNHLVGGNFKVSVPAGKEIMVGNPFMSTLDFRKFYELNQANIDAYYRLYVDNVWQSYSYASNTGASGGFIAPLQAFFISTKGSSGNVDLLFPPDMVSVTKPANKLREGASKDVLVLNARSNEGNSSVIISMNNLDKNVPQLFSAAYPGVPQLYTRDASHVKNVIQFEGSYEVDIPVGIMCNQKVDVTLKIENVENLNVKSLQLYDKANNTYADLLKNPVYPFKNDPEMSDRFILMVGKNNAATGIDFTETSAASIFTVGKVLHAKANEVITEITVSSVQGMQVWKDTHVSHSEYVKDLSAVTAGVYIVTAKLKNGNTIMGKIIIE